MVFQQRIALPFYSPCLAGQWEHKININRHWPGIFSPLLLWVLCLRRLIRTWHKKGCFSNSVTLFDSFDLSFCTSNCTPFYNLIIFPLKSACSVGWTFNMRGFLPIEISIASFTSGLRIGNIGKHIPDILSQTLQPPHCATTAFIFYAYRYILFNNL